MHAQNLNEMIDESLQQNLYLQKLIANPSKIIYCKQCRKDIQDYLKVINISCQQIYCLICFSNLQTYPKEYSMLRQIDYPLFDKNWTAKQQLLLFQGISKHGFGNWADIAQVIKTKNKQQVQNHYLQKYINNHSFLPSQNLITKKDNDGNLIYEPIHLDIKIVSNPPPIVIQPIKSIVPIVRTDKYNKANKLPSEIIGYLPKRNDFQIEYDNDAQFLLAQMEFNDDDNEEQLRSKYRLLNIYNHKLSQRIARKQFVISRNLLDIKQQVRLDKTRTKQQKQIYSIMKQHDRIVCDIIKQKQIRQRIQQLKSLKKKGLRTLGEVEDEFDKKKKQDRIINIVNKKKEIQYTDKSRRIRKDIFQQKVEKRTIYINKQQEELCKELNMTFKQYTNIKQNIIKESVKTGSLRCQDILYMFQEDRSIVMAVFEFLIRYQNIITQHDHYNVIVDSYLGDC